MGKTKTPAGIPPEPFASKSLNGYGARRGLCTQTGDLEACGSSDDDHGLETVVHFDHAAPPFLKRWWQCSACNALNATTPEGLEAQLEGADKGVSRLELVYIPSGFENTARGDEIK